MHHPTCREGSSKLKYNSEFRLMFGNQQDEVHANHPDQVMELSCFHSSPVKRPILSSSQRISATRRFCEISCRRPFKAIGSSCLRKVREANEMKLR